MRRIIYIAMFISLVSCEYFYRGNGIMTPRYIEDKASISKSIIDNIESYRISELYDEGKKIPEDQMDMIGYGDYQHVTLYGYSHRYNEVTGDAIPSPKDMRTQLNVITDTIFYSADSLLSFAFVVVERNYDNFPVIEKKEHTYDGFGVIGVRDSINQRFKVYPVNMVTFYDDPSYKWIVSSLRKFYFKEIKNSIGVGLNDEEIKHIYGVNDPRFFEDDPFFLRYENGLYNFQVWYNRYFNKKTEEYIFYSNTPEYLKKDWKN